MPVIDAEVTMEDVNQATQPKKRRKFKAKREKQEAAKETMQIETVPDVTVN